MTLDQMETLIQEEMDKLMTRTCPGCDEPKVFDIMRVDYLCEECRR